MNPSRRRQLRGLLPKSAAETAGLALGLAVAALVASRPVPRPSPCDPAHTRDLRFRLPVNTASATELTVLHGIGPQTAQRLVDHRQTHGPFPNAMALEDVPGIGPRTAQRITPWLRFD